MITQIKKILSIPLLKILHNTSKELFNDKGKICIVMGFSRSGTSVVCSLVSTCGYYFGESKDLKKANNLNPMGFFEHKKFFLLTDKLLRQSGYKKSITFPSEDLSAKGFLNRVRRVITRVQLMFLIRQFQKTTDRYAFKTTPLAFYFLKKYLSNVKIIGVYRDPITSAYSNAKVFGKGDTFYQLLRYWTGMNKEMIYHLSTNSSFLVKYEDLLSKDRQKIVVKKMSEFLGYNNSEELLPLIKQEFNRSLSETESLKKYYPIPTETKEVFNALESMRSY